MSLKSSYRNTELFVEHVAILKVGYLVVASKYGPEMETQKLGLDISKMIFFKQLKYQLQCTYFALLLQCSKLPDISYHILVQFCPFTELENQGLKFERLHTVFSNCPTTISKESNFKHFGLVCCLNGKRLS